MISMIEDIKSLKLAQLRKLAEEQGIAGWEDMDKKQLIAALSAGEIEKEKDEDETDGEEGGDDEQDSADEAPKATKSAPKATKSAFVPGRVKFGGFTEIAPGLHERPVAVGSKAENMKNFLAGQDKIRILMPFETGEKPGAIKFVTLNGYALAIEKGSYVEVPEEVANVVMESEKQTVAAINDPYKIDGDGPSALR